MSSPPSLLRALACAVATLFLPAAGRAQSPLPPEPLLLDALAPLRFGANWRIAGGLAGDPRLDKALAITPGTGVLVCNPGKDKETRTHLFTAWEHGDLDLDLEFLLTPGSNSGVYLQGRYEVQLFDSWGVKEPKPGDCGGIYQRWDAARGPGQESFEGAAPRANACRAPGLWQRLHIEFEAPRFDAAGRKTKNARFRKVVLNDFTIHENVEVTGPTRSSAFNDEAPLGPVMIQGDHGPVAIRALAVKRFGAEKLTVESLRYKLYAGEFKAIGAYEREAPTREGALERFAHGAVEKSGRFALVFTGALVAPRDGAYRFATEAFGLARLQIDGRDVVVPLERGSQPGIVQLAAGRHEFRLDFVQTTGARPALEVLAEGPGIAPHYLTVRDTAGGGRGGFAGRGGRGRTLAVEPKDRVLLQRGFVPFEPRKRLYAASVGTPAGVHFAYDFETGAVLRAWRGGFINAAEMWENRGNNQTAQPEGPALTFNARPAVAFIEFAANGDWPTEPESLWSSQGYTTEADGTPVFLSTLSNLKIRDRLTPAGDGRALERSMTVSGRLADWSAWMLLAEAPTITAQPGGHGWIVGDREWYLDWPADATTTAVVRTVNGRQQLAVPITTATLDKPIRYSIVW